MMSRSRVLTGPNEHRPGSVVQVLHCPAESGRARVMVLPAPQGEHRPRRPLAAWLLLLPLGLLPLSSPAPEDDAPLLDASVAAPDPTPLPSHPRVTVGASAGEVGPAPVVEASADDRFMAWEGQLGDATALDARAARSEAVEGIRLLAAALHRNGGGRLDAEVFGAMRWHGAQLARVAADDPYAEYAAAGHVHAAFAHAARLLAALPDVPGGVAGELEHAADAVGPRPLSAQRAAVRAFFRRAATVLAASAAP